MQDVQLFIFEFEQMLAKRARSCLQRL